MTSDFNELALKAVTLSRLMMYDLCTRKSLGRCHEGFKFTDLELGHQVVARRMNFDILLQAFDVEDIIQVHLDLALVYIKEMKSSLLMQ